MGKLIPSFVAALFLFVGLTVPASATCQGKPHDMHQQMHGNSYGYGHNYGNYDREAMAKTLELTEEQRAAVKEIWTKVQKDSITLQAEIQKTGIDLGTALSGNEPDFFNAKKASKTMEALKTKLKANYFDALEATYDLLTPEQKKNWGKAMEDFRTPQQPSAKECPLKGTKECPLNKKPGA